MTNDATRSTGPQFSSGPLITSAVLVGVGTLIALAGLAVGGSHLMSVTRRWIREMEVPPSELAELNMRTPKPRFRRTSAWRNGTQVQSADVS